jgi:hypothetical protein
MTHEKEIKRLEKQVTELSDALAHLSTSEDWKHLLQVLRRPGWTTPAELIFASAIIGSLHSQVAALAGLKGQLMKGSEAVVAK